MQLSDLIFRIVVPGHEYRIYASGRVEGFGNDVKIVNRFPQVCSDLLQAEQFQSESRDGAESPAEKTLRP